MSCSAEQDKPDRSTGAFSGPNALMPPLRPSDGLPDLGAAIRALIDEVDLRHAPMGFDFPDIHRKQSHTAGADDRSVLALVMLNVGWHVGSPLAADAAANLNPEPAYRGRRQRLINSFERNENRRILSAGVAFLYHFGPQMPPRPLLPVISRVQLRRVLEDGSATS